MYSMEYHQQRARELADKILQKKTTPKDLSFDEIFAMCLAVRRRYLKSRDTWRVIIVSVALVAACFAVGNFILLLPGFIYLAFEAYWGNFQTLPSSFYKLLFETPPRSTPKRYRLIQTGIIKNCNVKDLRFESQAARIVDEIQATHELWNRDIPRHSEESVDGYARSRKAVVEIETALNDIEMDIAKVVSNPLLFCSREPLNQEFAKALSYARMVEPQSLEPYDPKHPFIAATANLSGIWTALLTKSKSRHLDNFTPDEIGNLSRAQSLLNIAMSESGSISERQAAYRQAIKILDQIIVVPDMACREIETRILLSIER